jgi:hypothetical protein
LHYGDRIESDWSPLVWSETSLLLDDFESAGWQTNWDSYGTYGVNFTRSTTQAVSPTNAWMGMGVPTFGESRILYKNNTSIANPRIVAQFRNDGGGDWLQFIARSSAVNPLTNCYRLRFQAWELTNPAYYNYISLALQRYNAGVATTCFIAAVPFASARNTWHKIRWSVTTEYNEVLLKLEEWSGSAWGMVYEFRDSSPFRILTAGRAGFGMERCQYSNTSYFDDVNIISLAE